MDTEPLSVVPCACLYGNKTAGQLRIRRMRGTIPVETQITAIPVP